jgi:hypothetical protein
MWYSLQRICAAVMPPISIAESEFGFSALTRNEIYLRRTKVLRD